MLGGHLDTTQHSSFNLMKEFFILINFLSGYFSFSHSLAQLSAGDIAFVQYNADGSDEFAFVALVEIPANTLIYYH